MENKPIFVKIDEYKDIRSILDLVRVKIHEAKDQLEQIERLRHDEASELELWKSSIEDVENRANFIHQSLFGE